MDLINIVLPVFLVIGLGYGLRVAGLLSDQANDVVAKVVFYVAAPALLLHSTAQTTFDWRLRIPMLLVVCGITILVAFVVYAAGWRLAPERRGVLAQGAHRSNMVFVGLPIVLNAYGEAALAQASVLIAAMVVVYNLLAVLLLVLPHEQRRLADPRLWLNTAGAIVRNPLILACCGGVLYSLAGTDLPLSIDRSLALVGRAAAPLGLLSAGAGLDFRKLRAGLIGAVVAAGVKLIPYPALIFLCLRGLGFSGLDLAVPVLIVASPTAVVSYIMAREMRGDAHLAGAIVVISTVASLLTIMTWLAVLRMM